MNTQKLTDFCFLSKLILMVLQVPLHFNGAYDLVTRVKYSYFMHQLRNIGIHMQFSTYSHLPCLASATQQTILFVLD